MPRPRSSSRSCSRRSSLLLAALAACADPPPPIDPSAGWEPPPPAPSPSAAPTPSAPLAPSSAAPAVVAASRPRAEPFPGTSFPPAAAAPLHARTGQSDDGKWRPMIDGAKDGEPALARTRLHPHAFKKFVFVDVVAFDRRRIELHLVAGKDEPVSRAVGPERRPAVVPKQHHGALLAVFNGGFMARHGNYGMMLGGDVFVPPNGDACAVVRAAGGLHIGSWSALASTPGLRWWRQTPPCLVESGKASDRFARTPKRWGVSVKGELDIRRSAIGLDPSGRTLFYGFGDWVTAPELAAAMLRAGAVQVAQLDINWSYTRFFLFEHPPGEAPRIRETIIPKLKFDRKRYIDKKSFRDFFYVRLKDATPTGGAPAVVE